MLLHHPLPPKKSLPVGSRVEMTLEMQEKWTSTLESSKFPRGQNCPDKTWLNTQTKPGLSLPYKIRLVSDPTWYSGMDTGRFPPFPRNQSRIFPKDTRK